MLSQPDNTLSSADVAVVTCSSLHHSTNLD